MWLEEGRMKKKDLIPHAVFLGPASVLFLLAVVIPFIISVFYSLTDWNGIAKSYQFIGLKNYIDIFTGKSLFLQSAKFTVLLGMAVVLLTNILGVALAALLSNQFRGSNLFRAVFFLPNTMGGVVMGYIWRFLFLMVVSALGSVFSWKILQLPWLGTPGTAYAALIIVSVWQGAGYVMVIMIAALTGVPPELEEAAIIDGANAWRIFWKIKIPQCMPYIVVCLFWSIATSFKMFDVNVALTKGGPYGTTTSMAQQIYNDAFISNRYGLANAEAMVFFVIIFAVTFLQMYLTQRKERELP